MSVPESQSLAAYRLPQRLLIAIGALTAMLAASSDVARGQGPQSNHGSIRAVPVPRAVTIDGQLDEWDLTAEIHSYGVRRLRDRYSVRVAAMWDAEALYLGLRWRDPTPMINNVDVDAAPGDGWMADSFQGRFIVSGRQVHLTTCYSSKKDKAAAVLEYDAALNPNGRRTFVTQGMETRDPSGFQQAFRKDSDARGYVQELRIPWPLLGVGFQPRSGEKIGFTGEYFWGNASGTTWPAVMWSDPINPKNPVRIVIYQNPGVWGEMELLGQGNLPPATTTDDDPRLQGPLPLRFEIPADAAYFSVVINDERGRRIRNLASHQRVSDYAASAAPGVATRIIEIPWDGRPDGEWNSERSLFLGDTLVAPGTYVARCIVHRGVGVTFAGSFYNPGTPPWATADGTGAWGFDHANPQAVGTIPRDSPAKGRVFLGWSSGEGGVGFIGLDASGRKIWEWLRRGAGATHIAATRDFVYFTFAGEGFRLGRVNPDSGEQVPFSGGVLDVPLPEEPAGLAARGETIAVALPRKGVVQIRDTRTGELRTEHPVDTPGSLAIMANGEVVGVQGNKGLFTITAGGSAQLLVAPGSPLAVAADSEGRLYVSDRESLQVRVLPGIPRNVTGQLTAIGEPGGHVPGPWNPRRMGTPSSIAIEERTDGASRLWVTENQLSPRRVSVWDVASRALHRDYLGNTRYSASGGFLSDDLPGIGFVDGVSYRLDYVAGTYEPLEILGGSPRPVAGQVNVFTLGKGAGNFGNPNHFVSNASGQSREYIVEAGGTHPMIFMKRGERWQCVAALGSAAHPLPPGLPPPPSATSVFSWRDANGDGHQQSDEIVWHDLGKPRVFQCGWGYRCGRDLTFYHSGIAFRPVSFTEEGAPIYDVRRAERLPGELGNVHGDIHRTRFGFVADLPSGVDVDKHNVIHGLHHIAGFNDRGELIWKYPNYWLAVHGAFTAPMAMPGVLMGVLKVTGIFEPTADSGHSIISLRGNIGQEFLLRDDGMYLGELFTDQRMAPADLPATREIVGAPINETTLGGEPFNGWMGRQRDGKVRMTYGFTDVRVAEVTGLDQIVDIPAQSITVGERELAVMRDFQPRRVAARVTVAGIPRGPAFTDEEIQSASTYADSPTTLIVRSGREEVGRVTLRWDDQSLHLACQVADATPFVNKGIDAPLAFKTGDSVNLFIADRGEVQAGKMSGTRVLLCKLSGKPTTVAYRPSGPPGSTFVFESPVRESPFAHVGPIDDATFRVVPGMGGYAIGASVPWARLGVSPAAGKEMRGDIGLLFGDDTGAHTAQRVHWVDRETNVVNDVPTEAEFFPERWGTWKLLDPGETLTDVHSNGTSAEPVMDRPTKRDAGWRVVYSQDFDDLPVGLKTTEGALANWEGGSALGIVRDGGEGSTSGRYLAQAVGWQHFNFGPVFNVDLRQHPHTHVRVRFQLYTFGEWRGLHGKGSPHTLGFWDSKATHPSGRYFAFATVNDARQSFPDLLNQGNHPAATGARPDERIDLDESRGNDHRWPITIEYVSGTDELRFAMLSGWHALGGPPLPEPTFGIDDVVVEVLDARHGEKPGQPGVASPKLEWRGVQSPGESGARADVRFSLEQPAFVTLVVENAEGVRVRNLLGETYFPAGEHKVPWDGRDETCKNFRVCGLYDIDPQPVPSGRYRVRGLVRPEIDLRYELTVNNSGNPPWPKQDGTGRWLADHSPPSDVLYLPPGRAEHRGLVQDASWRAGDGNFVPSDRPLVLIASHVAESGDGLVWCDLDGKKIRGIRSLGAGGGWCGAERLARDAGPRANGMHYAFAATAWKNSLEIRALPSAEVFYAAEVATPTDLNCTGLAVWNELLAVALTPVNQVWLIDARQRKRLAVFPLNELGGVAFDTRGQLYIATERKVVRIAGLTTESIVADESGNLVPPPSLTKIVDSELAAPRQLLIDADELFVSDHGDSHQIKVFSLNGKLLRIIGQPGGMRLGRYDPRTMQQPGGMTIDERGRLWVAEFGYSPKRVSVWTRAGSFAQAFYGPPGYGGGGSLDPIDPTRFYLAYGAGLEFQIDWRTRSSVPVHRYWMDGPGTLKLGGDWHAAPQTPLIVHGRRYMTNAFSSSPGGFGQVVGIWRMENGLAVPAAAAGTFAAWPPLQASEFQSRAPAGADLRKVFFAWSDLNQDGGPQPEEITTAIDDGIQRNNGNQVGGVYVGPDLALVTAFGMRLSPERFTEVGVPIYDANRVERLVRQLEFRWVPYDAVHSATGWFITKAEPLRGFKDGRLMWTYPNQWPELHACLHEPPPLPKPGQFIGTMRWLGHSVTPRGSDVGEIFALTGYYGRIHLLTADGLCVGSLFQDARETGYFRAFEKLDSARPGLRMNDASLQTECFFDTITQSPDGRIYLQAGKSQCNVVRVDGLEGARRVPAVEFELR